MTGRLVIMGSGETAPTMVGTHRDAIAAADAVEVVVLDTPFGFQENVEQLTGKLTEFFEVSLSVGSLVPTLRTESAGPVEVERFRLALAEAAAVFAGPGSPSYALRVWRHHGVADVFADVVARGGTLTMASAAALTLGRWTIPVYEIYKVGEEPRWLDGLDVMSRLGVPSVVVPHWNNAEGGNHDTSRCYIGRRRLDQLTSSLDVGIVGVDEHTAAIFDFGEGRMSVAGRGTVTIRGDGDLVLESGASLELSEVIERLGRPPSVVPVGDADSPDVRRSFDASLAAADADGVIRSMLALEEQMNDDPSLRSELRSMIVLLGDAAGRGLVDPRIVVGGFVDLLLDLRRDARAARRYEDSDLIRDRLADLGVEVRDTPGGTEWDLSEPQNP